MIASKILGFSKVVHSENDFWNMIRCQPSRGISLNLYHRRCNASDIGVLGIQLPLEGRLDKDRLGATSRVLPALGSSPSCRHAPGAFIALVSTLPQEPMPILSPCTIVCICLNIEPCYQSLEKTNEVITSAPILEFCRQGTFIDLQRAVSGMLTQSLNKNGKGTKSL